MISTDSNNGGETFLPVTAVLTMDSNSPAFRPIDSACSRKTVSIRSRFHSLSDMASSLVAAVDKAVAASGPRSRHFFTRKSSTGGTGTSVIQKKSVSYTHLTLPTTPYV